MRNQETLTITGSVCLADEELSVAHEKPTKTPRVGEPGELPHRGIVGHTIHARFDAD